MKCSQVVPARGTISFAEFNVSSLYKFGWSGLLIDPTFCGIFVCGPFVVHVYVIYRGPYNRQTLKPPTHSLMGESYYYLFYKYDTFTQKTAWDTIQKASWIQKLVFPVLPFFHCPAQIGQAELVCQQNKNESPAADTTPIKEGTPQNRVWTLFKNNFQISRRFFSGCFITLYTNLSEWTYRKIPKISPGGIYFSKALFEGLIFG